MADLVQGAEVVYGDLRAATSSMVQEDWAYTMRRSMQEIVPGLFLGPAAAAGRKAGEELERVGISHIVCVRQNVESHFIRPHHQERCSYLVITLADSTLEPIIPAARWTLMLLFLLPLRESADFISSSLSSGGRVLVYCSDGMSRAPALVIAYLMQTYGLGFKAALNHVQQKRFCVQPNDGFEQQLREFEPMYRAGREVASRQGVVKRGREEEDEEVGYPQHGPDDDLICRKTTVASAESYKEMIVWKPKKARIKRSRWKFIQGLRI